MKPTDFWKILMQRKSILSSPTLFQRCCCWQLRVSLLPSYQGSPPLLWIGLPQGAPSPGHPGWKKQTSSSARQTPVWSIIYVLDHHQVGAWVPLRDSAHPGSHCHRPAHWGWSGSHRGSTWWLLQVTGILDTEVWQDEQTLQPADPEFWAANNLTTLWVFTPWELLRSMTKLYLAGSCQFSSWRQSWNSSMAWSRVWLWGEAKPFEVEPFAGHLKILQNNNKGSWNVLLNDAF